MAEFIWTSRREKAARLVAEDELSNEQIAAEVGVKRQSLDRWKQHPDFRARVVSILVDIRAAILQEGIAIRENRIKALNERHARMRQVIAERAEAPETLDVAGGRTGLIVHNVKGVGKGDDFQLIDLYEVDTGLLKELREHEKQAAQEVGQWTEKREVLGKIKLEALDDEELEQLERLVRKTADAG